MLKSHMICLLDLWGVRVGWCEISQNLVWTNPQQKWILQRLSWNSEGSFLLKGNVSSIKNQNWSFLGAPTVSRASVASVFSIASTSTVATSSSSSFTASSFSRRNRRRLGKILGGLKNKETYPSPHNGWWFFWLFIHWDYNQRVLFVFVLHSQVGRELFLPKRLWFSFGFYFHRCIGSSLTWNLRNSGGGTPFWWWCVFWKVGCRIWRVSVEHIYVCICIYNI